MAGLTFTATNQDELMAMPVHDQSILIDEVVASKGTLVLPMLIKERELEDNWMPDELRNPTLRHALYHSYRVPRRRSELRVANVVTSTVEDRSRIGSVDVNTLAYEGGRFRVKCIHEATVEAEVTALDVTLVVTDEVVDHLRYRVVCGMQFITHDSDQA